MKKTVNAGLNGLLNPNPSTVQEQAVTPVKQAKTPTKSVCYSLPVELDEKLHYIAYFDRKKINAVIVEALTAYVQGWTPAPQEKPKKL